MRKNKDPIAKYKLTVWRTIYLLNGSLRTCSPSGVARYLGALARSFGGGPLNSTSISTKNAVKKMPSHTTFIRSGNQIWPVSSLQSYLYKMKRIQKVKMFISAPSLAQKYLPLLKYKVFSAFSNRHYHYYVIDLSCSKEMKMKAKLFLSFYRSFSYVLGVLVA